MFIFNFKKCNLIHIAYKWQFNPEKVCIEKYYYYIFKTQLYIT